MLLGWCLDKGQLTYDAVRFEFSIAGERTSYESVIDLDDRALIRWRAMEQRDWMRRLDADLLRTCHENALLERASSSGRNLSPSEQVLADAARDDGVLAGAIVEADPALVQAVADELQKRGMALAGSMRQQHSQQSPDGPDPSPKAGDLRISRSGAEDSGTGNPLAQMDLPRGMEALSQMERAQPDRRDMTYSEKRLMKKILRNDDKAKAKRERLSPLRSSDSEAATLSPVETG